MGSNSPLELCAKNCICTFLKEASITFVRFSLRSVAKRRLRSFDCRGHLGGSVVERLSLAQVMILGSWDQVLHQVPCREPVFPFVYVSAYVSASLCVCLS